MLIRSKNWPGVGTISEDSRLLIWHNGGIREGEICEDVTMQTSRIIDRLSGRGGVERDGEIICDVDYEIIVSQSASDSQTSADAETPRETADARGRLRVLEGKRNLMEGDLTLLLTDGRKWVFTVTNGNPVSALYIVVQAGGDSLAPGAAQT